MSVTSIIEIAVAAAVQDHSAGDDQRRDGKLNGAGQGHFGVRPPIAATWSSRSA